MANQIEQLAEKIAKMPLATRLGVAAAVVILVTAGNWYLFTDDFETQIVRSEAQRRKLEGEYVDKKQIANNLNEYRREKELLEQRLADALAELPEDKAIDDLLRQIHDLGVKTGLRFVSIEPQPEVKESFFARIPLRMKVSGSYHEFGVFFDSVGKLKRIVNIAELRFGKPEKAREKVIFEADFYATTFRFLSKEEMPAPDPKAAGKAGKGRK